MIVVCAGLAGENHLKYSRKWEYLLMQLKSNKPAAARATITQQIWIQLSIWTLIQTQIYTNCQKEWILSFIQNDQKNAKFIGIRYLVWFINPMSSINIGILIAKLSYHSKLICVLDITEMSQSVVSDVLNAYINRWHVVCQLMVRLHITNNLINMSRVQKCHSDSYRWAVID